MLELKRKETVTKTKNVLRAYYPYLEEDVKKSLRKLVNLAVRESKGISHHFAQRLEDGYVPLYPKICREIYNGGFNITDIEILLNDNGSVKDIRAVIKSNNTYEVLVDKGHYLQTCDVYLVLVYSLKTFMLITGFTNDYDSGIDYSKRSDLYINVD